VVTTAASPVHGIVQPAAIPGRGLELRPWDREGVRQLSLWGERGFPYHAFDLSHLRDPKEARAMLARIEAPSQHLHFIAYAGQAAVGRVSVNLADQSGLYLWGVHVPPEASGAGVCRRMLATLMVWLEEACPGRDFVLTTNAFATHAHRAYAAVGFHRTEVRWHFDRELALALWDSPPSQREPIARFIRFHNGRWEVRAHIMRRRPGAPMSI